MKQWGLHWVQVHQGDCSQQKTRFTHWQKWKWSLFPCSSPPSTCTCKLLAFSCNMEITQMVIILRKTFAFCKKASSLGKLWCDFLHGFPFPCDILTEIWKEGLLSQESRAEISCQGLVALVYVIHILGFCKKKARRSWGHRHILNFLALCFTSFISVLFKVTMSVKITDTSASKRTTCFGVTFILFLFFALLFLFLCSVIVPGKSRMPYTLIPLAFLFGNH